MRLKPGGDAPERLIPFSARSAGEPEPLPRRRREVHDFDRQSGPRRARRRRRGTPWLQRNALSVAAVSVLVALLGLGFGLLQMISRPEPTPALMAGVGQSDAGIAAGTTLTAAATGPGVQIGSTSGSLASSTSGLVVRREIQATARVIEPNYTVEAGDTLARIAVRFNTTVERIQALNNLADPRTLRIGARLVIPPPL